MTARVGPPSAWSQACLAAALFAVDPMTCGVALRCGAGPVRDAWLNVLSDLLPAGAPLRRVPSGIADDRLLGGIDLSATLRAGRPIAEAGILAQANGGVLILAMAERLSASTAARIAAALDLGEVIIERDGAAMRLPACFGVVAFDEGQSDDEMPPPALLDRLAFHVDLNAASYRECASVDFTAAEIRAASARLGNMRTDDSAIQTLAGAAAQLGVVSLRAPLLALRTARALAALRGGETVKAEDIASAARLVLAPRATALPEAADGEEQGSNDESPSDGDSAGAETAQDYELPTAQELNDLVLSAALASIPPGMLAQIEAGSKTRSRASGGGKSGVDSGSTRRGRPIGARRGELCRGRLSLVETLRAAAPWQKLRRLSALAEDRRAIIVKLEDIRVARFKDRTQTTAIFVVDASGSAAMQRLAEVKGAIELLLADCYVRRESVAMIAFRGRSAEIILPPTRSLVLAKRRLAGLPGGGGTPIAAGLTAALALADSVRRKGPTPLVVLMSDGRANVGRDGSGGRAKAFDDAIQAGKALRAAGIACLAIDTAGGGPVEAEPPTLRLGKAMNARYIKLPHAAAAAVSAAVRAASVQD